jgi:DNA-binding response OmpR family regulator
MLASVLAPTKSCSVFRLIMKKIIFLDDDPTILDMVPLIFEGEYDVQVYSDGRLILKNDFAVPDLFLLDRQLSGLDGLDICRFLKQQEQTKNIPIVMISATRDIIQQAKLAGADDVIEKPFPIKELRKMIHNHISKNGSK